MKKTLWKYLIKFEKALTELLFEMHLIDRTRKNSSELLRRDRLNEIFSHLYKGSEISVKQVHSFDMLKKEDLCLYSDL